MVWQLITTAFAVGDVLTGWMDARITNKGIKAGIGVEANELIVKLAGTDKPSLTKLVAYNLGKQALWLGIGAIFAWHFPVHAPAGGVVYLGRVAMPVYAAVDAAKHYQGFREWAWMFRNPGKRIEDMTQTAWQKFIGFWG